MTQGHVHVSPAFQHPFVTPSPFYNNSIPSTGWSSKPVFLRHANLILRCLGFSSPSPPSSPSSPPKMTPVDPNLRKPGIQVRTLVLFSYWLSVNSISSLYSAIQLFKCIWDISFKSTFISDVAYDYITFSLDQMVTYLLLSSTSVSILATVEKIDSGNYRNTVALAICMSFIAFAVTTICSLMSGYKLCKRISW
ncbi:unnamed protein product [Spirodela intermedia]|uniref:CASP-like protein n=1 Tax=Spirodela intermedia TaxID=51605 RepID=A0A7I8J7I3_SPIIN|nr:unnamed protein product [Spirodela intermedia]CAA6665372.1 unnamed protein product [Spirodela intermedia]CAA6674178.1 unnamed protein product [Spirodela intermedia]